MEEGSSKEICAEIFEIWEQSRSNWHRPLLPRPSIVSFSSDGPFPFENYSITLNRDTLLQGHIYIENLFDHLIVHYIFCPRSLEIAANLALSSVRGLENPSASLAKRMLIIFSDIVVDSFRFERSSEDQEKVLVGWKRLCEQSKALSGMDRVIIGFLANYWSVQLPRCDRPEVDLLLALFSPGVRDRSLWTRQCQQMAKILEPLEPGFVGKGQVRSLEILNGSANATSLAGFASSLEPAEYKKALSVLGLNGDLKRWYRDQSGNIEIKHSDEIRVDEYPSGLTKWRPFDPLSDLDLPFSLSLSPKLIPGVTTYKRESESSRMSSGKGTVPDLLIVLDSSRSMDGHAAGTKTHKATLASFKAASFAHSRGADVAAINFSERYLVQTWTRDLNAVEDVLVEYFCGRTSIPGKVIEDIAASRKGCMILCITDTHIQNLYLEWDNLRRASEASSFVLFCIDQAGRDRHVEEALRSLGKVYYVDRWKIL